MSLAEDREIIIITCSRFVRFFGLIHNFLVPDIYFIQEGREPRAPRMGYFVCVDGMLNDLGEEIFEDDKWDRAHPLSRARLLISSSVIHGSSAFAPSACPNFSGSPSTLVPQQPQKLALAASSVPQLVQNI
jgi:hypothetical protein